MAAVGACAMVCDACGAGVVIEISLRTGGTVEGVMHLYVDLDDASRARLDGFVAAHRAPRAARLGETPGLRVETRTEHDSP